MLCDACGKNEATVHIVQIGPDGKTERNLCVQCAMGFGEQLQEPLQKKDLSLNEFLQGVFRGADTGAKEPGEPVQVCPSCGMGYDAFLQSGRMGCPECYHAFEKELEPILRRVHGVNVHKGKIPRRSGGEQDTQQAIVRLRAKLQQAVEDEEYERAAEYRDRIRELERKLGEGNGHAE